MVSLLILQVIMQQEVKMFNQVLDKLGVDMTHQELYEVFDKIYEEGVREKKEKNNRNCR